jgi:hypothetical protein
MAERVHSVFNGEDNIARSAQRRSVEVTKLRVILHDEDVGATGSVHAKL